MAAGWERPRFYVASPQDIRNGRVTDVYFLRGKAALEAEGENPPVTAEIRAASLPEGWSWAIFAGLEEALALPEGSAFRA